MTSTPRADQPDDRSGDVKKARVLAIVSILYLLSCITLILLVMGGSQALKTGFIDDAMSMLAPILFLVGDRISRRKPTERYPYGFARAVSAAYLGASVMLVCVGALLLFEAGVKLVQAEHPTIGGIRIFGHVLWLGWLALPVLFWSAAPAWFLGRAKMNVAKRIGDKVLLADAQASAADWQSGACAMVGVLGIAAGLWWLDGVAAVLISFEIIRSGFKEVRSALGDLMDRRPEALGSKGLDPMPEELTHYFKALPWVRDAVVRVREEGRNFTADVFVIPSSEETLLDRLEKAGREARKLDWRLTEVVVTPIRRMPPGLNAIRADQPEQGSRQSA